MESLRTSKPVARSLLHPPKRTVNFLLPAFTNAHILSSRHKASITTSQTPQSAEPSPESVSRQGSERRQRPLSRKHREFLDSALRVNQAGELAATLIYTHQTPPLLRKYPHLRSLMQRMYAQEAGHLATFNHLLAHHRIRPTAMYPIWTAAASTLGWATGLMGREAAMACTEAVETEIGAHYNGQVRVLLQWTKDMEERGEEAGDEIKELLKTLKRIRDEELEHLDEAVRKGAKEAKPYQLLNRIIRSGCKGAIWISERM